MSVVTEVVGLTRQLVDISSLTGDESRAGDRVCEILEADGWQCTRQPVSGSRFNVLAGSRAPQVLLTTHIDTVPPFFPSSEDEQFVYGRGSCDAKGIAAAMICAARRLSDEERRQLALLFVVGEETDSDGARRAIELGLKCGYVIDGEPTDNELAVGHKGVVWVRLTATGVTCHSAYPEKGESATRKLVEVLYEVSRWPFAVDSTLGPTLVNIGRLAGGIAPNVLSDRAEAEILVRTVTPSETFLEELRSLVAGRCNLEVLRTSEPQRMVSVPGFASKVVGFGTDIPVLRELGPPLLVGPGSIFDAHTAGERISKAELSRAVDLYVRLIRQLIKG